MHNRNYMFSLRNLNNSKPKIITLIGKQELNQKKIKIQNQEPSLEQLKNQIQEQNQEPSLEQLKIQIQELQFQQQVQEQQQQQLHQQLQQQEQQQFQQQQQLHQQLQQQLQQLQQFQQQEQQQVQQQFQEQQVQQQVQQQFQEQNHIEGPTGPSGKDGDRFCTKTQQKMCLTPKENSLFAINVEPGLAYISGNSVIVAEVVDNLTSELNTFEGTIHYYNASSGQIIIKDITNIHGVFEKESIYHINLDGVDGAPGEPGAVGPTGPSNVSSTTTIVQLLDDTIMIPQQVNPITYYSLHIKNTDELKNISSQLNNNQTAIILIHLCDADTNSNTTAFIFPIQNVNINYNQVITLNNIIPFAMFRLYNIENLHFGECVTYYKNTYYTNV